MMSTLPDLLKRASLAMGRRSAAIAIVVCFAAVAAPLSPTVGQQIRSGVSARETYVGQPVYVEIEVSDAPLHQPPVAPEVDGLEISSAGPPARSSMLRIINGRRTESSSITYRFAVVPRRPGQFSVPPFTIETGRGPEETRPFSLVASQSETGDLMFVEVTGSETEAFVGQPVQLKLKIWLRPFTDRERGLRLSEGNMWSLIGPSTNWGVFAETLKQMAANNQRPGGEEVLRETGDGDPKAYYLYEIDAEIYPQKPGPIDVGGVQIVVSYPTRLGTRRSRFPSMFDDNDLFSSGLMEEFFRDSPFNRETLTLEATRPIAAGATLPEMTIRDVPTEGRPDDYRGAVGRYEIVTRANPTSVKAGDPINLQILLQGDGPMELVPAPPLNQVASLTSDFQVRDDNLAGYVEGDAKLFTTTIRPRREGVAQIPPIPFTFFDPEKEAFETVYSQPISIDVAKAEVLSLDEIAGDSRPVRESTDRRASETEPAPLFTDLASADKVLRESAGRPGPFGTNWLWWIPPGLFAISWLTFSISRNAAQSSDPARHLARGIRRAQTAAQLVALFDRAFEGVPPAELRDVWEAAQQAAFSPLPGRPLNELKEEALAAIRRRQPGRSHTQRKRALIGTLIGGAFLGLAPALWGTQPADTTAVSLNREQQQILIEEANELCRNSVDETDSAVKADRLAEAIQKYELVLASGLTSASLRTNLGQALWAAGQPARAVAQLEIARRLDPGNRQILGQLRQYKRSMAQQAAAPKDAEGTNPHWQTWRDLAVQANRELPPTWTWAVALASWWGLWGLAAWAGFGQRKPRAAWWIATSLVLAATLGSLFLHDWDQRRHNAVITASSVDVRQGDGDSFAILQTLPGGSLTEIIDTRGDWARIESDRGSGWLPAREIDTLPQPRRFLPFPLSLF